MALLGDVERVPVIGAEGHERGCGVGYGRNQRVQIFRHRAFAHQHRHALGEFFHRLGGGGRLVVGADGGSEVAVEREAAQQRGVAVNVPVLKRGQFGQHAGISGQNAGEIHEFSQANDVWVRGQRQQIGDFQPRAGSFEMGCGHAGGELNPQVHDGVVRGIEKIPDAGQAQHIGNLVRITNRRGDAMRKHAAVKLRRADERGFDMQVRVDKARHEDFAGDVNFSEAGIFGMGADDAGAANGDIRAGDLPRNQIKDPPALEHEVGGGAALPLGNGAGEMLRIGERGHGAAFAEDGQHHKQRDKQSQLDICS